MIRIKIGERYYNATSLITKYGRGILFIYISGLSLLLIKKKKKRIITTGHTYNGNAKAFSEWLVNNTDEEVGFACDDPELYKNLKGNGVTPGVKLLSIHSIRDCFYIAKSAAICTTHGPSFFKPWSKRKNKPLFIGLWHGVGFKGTMRKNVKRMDFFDAFFVSSPFFKRLHEKWGFPYQKLYVTGYSRTDKLVNDNVTDTDKANIFDDYGLGEQNKNVILFAPTWKKKNNGRLDVFGEDLEKVLSDLDKVAKDNKSIIVFRPHLNSDIKFDNSIKNNLRVVPSSKYPDTENLLLITDLLITDWSSIFTDYLALKKPMIFLDSNPEFEMTALDKNDRPGEKVKNINQLIDMINSLLSKKKPPKKNINTQRVINKSWGDTLDGRSSERYYKYIKELLNK